MHRERRPQRGASMTEFIIITPVALLLMLSILQFALVYMAKSTVNNAVFMAARQGATQNASMSAIQGALARGLIPFHLKTSASEPGVSEMTQALGKATADILAFGKIEIVSPAPQAFTHFGLKDAKNQTYIPNDNLEYRLADQGHTRAGPGGGMISIRDANVLKLQVTYGYELKVPLVRTVLKKIMCLGQAGGGEVDAWRSNVAAFDPGSCRYWQAGRLPLVAQATVQMQSNAYEGERLAGLDGVGGGDDTGGGSDTGGGTGDDDGGGNDGGGDDGGEEICL